MYYLRHTLLRLPLPGHFSQNVYYYRILVIKKNIHSNLIKFKIYSKLFKIYPKLFCMKHIKKKVRLKWYYDKKNQFLFSFRF